jgi:internalin A
MRKLLRKRRTVNEFKLVLVGRPHVGKTTLVHRLVRYEFRRFGRTPGVKITEWDLGTRRNPLLARVWDFGGQEIMHGTHRFFMTEQAIYLVLVTGREETEDRDAEYWLSLVRSFAGDDVQIIVLLHKQSEDPVDLNRPLLRAKYGHSISFLETDSETGQGITALRKEIARRARKLPGLKAAWPVPWLRVKEELPAASKHWMTFGAFREFCSERGITSPEHHVALAERLHSLGLMLSYQRTHSLRRFGILNPVWVTRGIYDMLNSSVLKAAHGEFTVASFADVLPARAYPKTVHAYLLDLMRTFELCHPVDDGEKHLIPELLPKDEPKKLDDEFDPGKCLRFTYEYETILPEDLVPRFIVATYVHRDRSVAAWRTGVILKNASCRALIRGDVQARTIAVRVKGRGRREFLGVIRDELAAIHASYQKLAVIEQIPVGRLPEHSVRRDMLLKYLRDGRDEVLIEAGDELKELDVRELLYSVDVPQIAASNPIPVFIIYSQKDRRYLDELRGMLALHVSGKELEVCADDLLEPGQLWRKELDEKLRRARIIIPLLSPDFFASSYVMEVEIPRALARQKRGECAVAAILVRDCRWEKFDFGEMQIIAPGNKAIANHPSRARRGSAWVAATRELDKVIARITPAR